MALLELLRVATVYIAPYLPISLSQFFSMYIVFFTVFTFFLQFLQFFSLVF